MPDRVTAHELEEYWKYIENLTDNDVIDRYVETSQMPPWDEICSELNWRTYTVDDGYFSKRHHGYCGVYRLIGLTTERPLKSGSIRRACGEDGTGTLYVGEAGWLNERLNQLRRSLHGEDTHGASRMWRQSSVLKAKFPANKLGVSMLFTRVGMHKWIERDLIRAYLNTFGDTPPLNCSF
jgi:hypothetical protein